MLLNRTLLNLSATTFKKHTTYSENTKLLLVEVLPENKFDIFGLLNIL